MPIELKIEQTVSGVPHWPALASMALSFTLLGLLVSVRRIKDVRPLIAAFLINNLAIAATLFVTNRHYALAPRTWIPFQPDKLSMLTAAVLAPTPLVGVITIGIFGGGALARYATFDPAIKARLPIGEPWALVAFLLFAGVILFYRNRQQRLEQQMVEAQSEAAALAQVARTFLAVRDLVNTPLQTIAAVAALLDQIPAGRVQADRLRRSLERMKELEQILGEESRPPSSADSAAFDALFVLKRLRA
jgi:hypothetical protein